MKTSTWPTHAQYTHANSQKLNLNISQQSYLEKQNQRYRVRVSAKSNSQTVFVSQSVPYFMTETVELLSVRHAHPGHKTCSADKESKGHHLDRGSEIQDITVLTGAQRGAA